MTAIIAKYVDEELPS